MIKSLLFRIDSRPVFCFLVLVILSALFLLVASPYTSPFNSYYIGDYAVFSLMGKGMIHGLIPYKDLFDHKGPLLYFIYAAGEWVWPNKCGVYFIQVINITVCFLAIYRLFRLYLSTLLSWCLLFIVLIVFPGCMGEGALTEEWSVSWSMVALYLVVRHLTSGQTASNLPAYVWFLLGFSFGVHFLLRITNASAACGLILAISSIILCERQFKKLFFGMVWCSLGTIAIIMPCWIFLWCTDSINEYVYSYFEYNSLYAVSGMEHKDFHVMAAIAWNLSSLPLLLVASWYLLKKKVVSTQIVVCVVSLALLTAVSLLPGYDFLHYYMSYMPTLVCFLLFSGKIVSIHRSKKLALGLALAIILTNLKFLKGSFIIVGAGLCSLLIPNSPATVSQRVDCGRMFRSIYEGSGCGTVMCYEVPPEMYLYMGVLPSCKYFFQTSSMTEVAPSAEEFIKKYFEGERAPDWVVIPHTDREEKKEIASLNDNRRCSSAVKNYLSEKCERVAYGERKVGRHSGKKRGVVYSLYHRIR